MQTVIQVTPASAAGLKVALHPPTAASERVLEATRPDTGEASTFPTGTPGRRPCCAITKPDQVSAGSSPRAGELPEPCSCSPVPPALAEPDEGALN